jgi:hypothetical protein
MGNRPRKSLTFSVAERRLKWQIPVASAGMIAPLWVLLCLAMFRVISVQPFLRLTLFGVVAYLGGSLGGALLDRALTRRRLLVVVGCSFAAFCLMGVAVMFLHWEWATSGLPTKLAQELTDFLSPLAIFGLVIGGSRDFRQTWLEMQTRTGRVQQEEAPADSETKG